MIKKIKIIYTAMSIVLALAGVVMLIYPNLSVAFLSTFIGVILIILGGIGIVAGLIGKGGAYAGLVLGVISAAAGVLFAFHPQWILDIVPRLIGLVVLISGLSSLKSAGDVRRSGANRWWIGTVTSLITCALGILFMVRSFEVGTFAVRVCGLAFIIAGISKAFSAIVSLINDRKYGTEKNDDPAEPKYIDYEEVQ